MIELLSSDDEDDDNEDESVETFYEKFSSQLEMNDSTTNHLLNQKYIESFQSITNIARAREKK